MLLELQGAAAVKRLPCGNAAFSELPSQALLISRSGFAEGPSFIRLLKVLFPHHSTAVNTCSKMSTSE